MTTPGRHDFRVLAEDAVAVAPAILGWRLVSEVGGVTTAVSLTEVEAYRGAEDPASHAFNGPTGRNAVMFGPPGRLYVYLSYGIHSCANVVTWFEGRASAVLIRGGEIVRGREVIEQRRGRADHLTDGPGKLCRALGITRDHYGIDLTSPESIVRLEPDARPDGALVVTGPRVGVSRAADRPWRFRLRAG